MPLKKYYQFDNFHINLLVRILQKKGPFFASAIILIIVIWQSAKLFWTLYPNQQIMKNINIPSVMLANQTSVNSIANQPNKIAANIINQNLFGQYTNNTNNTQNSNIINQPAIENLKETQLTLLLKGTVSGNNGPPSLAIISNNSDEEKVYSINDLVAPGISLHSVYADQIIIDNNNELEVLKLPKELVENTPTVIRNSRVNKRTSVTQISKTAIAPLNQFGTKLADTIRPTPYFSDGAQLGYRVYPGSNRKQFMSLGLLSGDLITNVNGTALNDAQKAMTIFQEIENENQVSLTIIRNNESQKINISTSQFLEN
jgi:general secretion pathway protein C